MEGITCGRCKVLLGNLHINCIDNNKNIYNFCGKICMMYYEKDNNINLNIIDEQKKLCPGCGIKINLNLTCCINCAKKINIKESTRNLQNHLSPPTICMLCGKLLPNDIYGIYNHCNKECAINYQIANPLLCVQCGINPKTENSVVCHLYECINSYQYYKTIWQYKSK